jgi:hypothetical protein
MSRNKKPTCDTDTCEVPKEIVHLLIDFTLPPPVYGYELTTKKDKAERTIKYVKSISKAEGAVIVISAEGIEYNIPVSRVQYWQEE